MANDHQVDDVRMLDRLSNTGASSKASGATGPLGTLYLTATHLIFVDHEGKRETWILHSLLCHLEKVLVVSTMVLSSVFVLQLSISTVGTPLNIRCKNFRQLTFVIPKGESRFDRN